MIKLIGDGYRFIATEPIAQERLDLGYEDMNRKYSFVVCTYDGEEQKELAKKLGELTVEIKAKSGENGKLFVSVTSKEIVEELLGAHHIKIDKKKLVLPDGIKTLGTTEVEIKLHPGVSARLKVSVTEK